MGWFNHQLGKYPRVIFRGSGDENSHAQFFFGRPGTKASQPAGERDSGRGESGRTQPTRGVSGELCWVGYENDESHENIRYLGYHFLLLQKIVVTTCESKISCQEIVEHK